MDKTTRRSFALFSILFILAFIPGCGGGGSGDTSAGSIPPPASPPPSEPFPARMLSWQPPTSYSDGSPLTPARDLANFEIYVKENGGFSGSDSPMALLSAIDPGTGQLQTSFNLANLGPYISRGVLYQVALRAVANNGEKSAFSSPAAFSF